MSKDESGKGPMGSMTGGSGVLARHTAWVWRPAAEGDGAVAGTSNDAGTVIWLMPDQPRDMLRMARHPDVPVRDAEDAGRSDEAGKDEDDSRALVELSDTVERAMIRRAMEQAHGDVEMAARWLGTTGAKMRERAAVLGIQLPGGA